MILPARFSIMSGSTALEQLKAPPTWTSITRIKSAWLISIMGTRFIRPALFTRMSTGPTSALIFATMAFTASSSETSAT